MYIPSHFKETDVGKLKDFIRKNDFATVISQERGRPIASHLLVELTEDPSGDLYLNGHMARGNPQWKTFLPAPEVLVIFLGPHTCISPTWYAAAESVPTWNYIAAHVYGVPRIISDHDELHELLRHLVERHESTGYGAGSYDLKGLPEAFVENMMGGVVGFRIEVERIEASYKLSQNRKEKDFENVIIELNRRTDQNSHEVAEETEGVRMKRNRNEEFGFGPRKEGK